jgi:hypothetical protein
MNLEALREQGDSILYVTTGPSFDNAFQVEGFSGINAANPGVRVRAAQESCMKHVGQANIPDVGTVAGKKAARLVGFNAAADEWG